MGCRPRRPAVLLLGLAGAAAVLAPATAASTPRPDLVVARPATPVTGLAIGAPATVAISVRNSGRATAGASKLGLYLSRDARLSRDDIAVGTARAGRLRRGKARLLRITFTVPATVSPSVTYTLLACADAGKAVRESRERGNCRVLLKARPAARAAPGGSATPAQGVTPPAGTPVPEPAPPNPTPAGLLAGGCRIFPPGNPWERDVRADPIDPDSAQILVNESGATAPGNRKLTLSAFSDPAGGFGVPVNIAPPGTPALPVSFATTGDPGPYPITANALIEGWTTAQPVPDINTDRHLISVEQGTCRLAELFGAARTVTGYDADIGMLLDLTAPYSRPAGSYGSMMAGVPQLPGLLRQGDLASASVDHALYVSLPASRHAYLPPASACGTPGQNASTYLPMGGRLRLKSTFDTAPYGGGALAILRGLQRHGLMLVDRSGSPGIGINAEPGALLTGIVEQFIAHPVTLADFEALSTAGASTAGC